MNSAELDSPPWSRRKWWGMVLGLFGVQVALLCWFGARGPVKPKSVTGAPQLQFAGPAAAEIITLLDPTLFAQSHPQGFSGSAWMAIPVEEYRPPEWSEPLRWLAMDVQQLGGDFRRFVQTNQMPVSAFAANPSPRLASPEIEESSSITTRPSTLRVEGALVSRRMLNPPTLQARLYPDLLTNSVVQVLVDGDGNVFSPVLLARSGMKEADDDALAAARSAQFEPLPRNASRSGLPVTMTLGTLVFEWQTLPSTNTPSANP